MITKNSFILNICIRFIILKFRFEILSQSKTLRLRVKRRKLKIWTGENKILTFFVVNPSVRILLSSRVWHKRQLPPPLYE